MSNGQQLSVRQRVYARLRTASSARNGFSLCRAYPRSGMIKQVRTSQRFLAASSVAVVVMGLIAACSSGPDQPRTVAEQFARALSEADVDAAAALTTYPETTAESLTAIFAGLGALNDASTREFTVADADGSADAGTFSLNASWTFGESADGNTWTYVTEGRASVVDGQWRIDYEPAVVIPQMGEGQTVRYTSTFGPAPDILSASGAPLMQEQTVTVVSMTDTVDTAALATLLSPIAPTITAQSLRESLTSAQEESAQGESAPGESVTAVTLRADDVAPIAEPLRALDGVELSEQRRLLTVERDLASPLFGDLAALWQERQDASAGWAVQLVDADGSAQTLTSREATGAQDVTTTIDLSLQQAAEAALADLPQQSALVAIRPSNGEVVALAQNPSADASGPLAFTGLYPPGSTFKTVTTSAALQSGEVTPNSIVACPGTENIEGRQIPNDDNFDLGSVPLHTSFAYSCNTTMGRLAVGLAPDALTKAATQFGLGVDYVSAGMTTVTGSVPAAESPAARVEAAIGQGTVTASPFGMAVVAAAIAHGAAPMPTIVRGARTTAEPQPGPVPQEVTEALRAMMREVVTDGTASALSAVPGLLGKTGTAETGSGSAHGWFVGIRGDLAFAVFVADAGSSAPAVQVAGRFLS